MSLRSHCTFCAFSFRPLCLCDESVWRSTSTAAVATPRARATSSCARSRSARTRAQSGAVSGSSSCSRCWGRPLRRCSFGPRRGSASRSSTRRSPQTRPRRTAPSLWTSGRRRPRECPPQRCRFQWRRTPSRPARHCRLNAPRCPSATFSIRCRWARTTPAWPSSSCSSRRLSDSHPAAAVCWPGRWPSSFCAASVDSQSRDPSPHCQLSACTAQPSARLAGSAHALPISGSLAHTLL